ncbi:MAG: molybdate ABC transporter substrate-binding protein [Betaproteobacteria bacterium]|nr:molybdate ABC transporter substrate-binding protein [Betaproteobacteria bacterium]
MKRWSGASAWGVLWAWALATPLAWAAEVSVAVAANFAAPMKRLAVVFEQTSGHRAVVSLGATGALYAQVINGAPFHVFLAADQKTPQWLESQGQAVEGTRFTYATGRLVLWSATPGLVDGQGEVLRTPRFQKLAIANPKVAPYGAAALEVMERMGLAAAVRPRLVQGDNIAQAHQFTASGNAQLGFVALSQVMVDGRLSSGSAWVVPAHLHPPLKQDAVLLRRGVDTPAARAFMDFLRSDAARAIIRAHGYED